MSLFLSFTLHSISPSHPVPSPILAIPLASAAPPPISSTPSVVDPPSAPVIPVAPCGLVPPLLSRSSSTYLDDHPLSIPFPLRSPAIPVRFIPELLTLTSSISTPAAPSWSATVHRQSLTVHYRRSFDSFRSHLLVTIPFLICIANRFSRHANPFRHLVMATDAARTLDPPPFLHRPSPCHSPIGHGSSFAHFQFPSTVLSIRSS